MAAPGFNIGEDCTLYLEANDGTKISFSRSANSLLDVKEKPMTTIIRQKSISDPGKVRRRSERDGYALTLTIGRSNADFDKLEARLQNRYRAQLSDLSWTAHMIVINRDGTETSTESKYTNCLLWKSDGPGYKPGDNTTLTVELEGDDCIFV